MIQRKILINRTHETVLRFLPPFLLAREHVDQTIDALHELLAMSRQSNLPKRDTLAGETIHG